jgi:CheY-like chemotaxis protein
VTNKAKILIVEDDVSSIEVLSEMLAMTGYTVETACTAEDAIAALGSRSFDAALLDLTLSAITPNKFVELIRAVPGLPPLVIFSARLPDEIRAAAERLGAAAALQKPASMDVLLGTLARVLGRA